MVPIDDPTWPNCNVTGCFNNGTEGIGWCEHIRQWLMGNQDGNLLEPGEHYCVPLFPERLLYARVSLDTEILNDSPAMCRLALVKPNPDDVFGVGDDEFINVGIHTHGEGRILIAIIILDWLAGQPTQTCTYHQHGFTEERMLQQILGSTVQAVDANKFAIAYFGNCLACRQAMLQKAGVPEQQWTASSFGLDDGVPKTDPNEQATLAQIRAMLGM